MALGMFMFSAVDTMAKFLTDTIHPSQIVWCRQLGLLLGVVVLVGLKGRSVLVSASPALQIGRGAPGFDGGRFSPAMDGPTHAFHQWVATRMAPGEA